MTTKKQTTKIIKGPSDKFTEFFVLVPGESSLSIPVLNMPLLSIILLRIEPNIGASIGKIKDVATFKVYPNPAKEVIVFETAVISKSKIFI